ncbi:hypothetical protein EP331_08510 [bacterium]|nr:MAG: hypothetical protein EP331_08510 [bacterium]
MSTVTRRSDNVFSYPPNLQVLDLATLVAMYRERGAVSKANPGDYLACCATGKLMKEAKFWFGLNYSQQAWDTLLTKNSGGYPLTEVELNILGLIKAPPYHPIDKEFIAENCGIPPHLAIMIIQDLKKFGYVDEDEDGFHITISGEKALDGICRRIYEINFIPEMLLISHDERFNQWYKSGRGPKDKQEQTSLF